MIYLPHYSLFSVPLAICLYFPVLAWLPYFVWPSISISIYCLPNLLRLNITHTAPFFGYLLIFWHILFYMIDSTFIVVLNNPSISPPLLFFSIIHSCMSIFPLSLSYHRVPKLMFLQYIFFSSFLTYWSICLLFALINCILLSLILNILFIYPPTHFPFPIGPALYPARNLRISWMLYALMSRWRRLPG